MHAQDRFLRKLFERTGGRTNYTVHAFLHVARPLALSPREAQASVATLVRQGLIGVDPMFDRLIWLTPAGVAACTRTYQADAVVTITRNGSLLSSYFTACDDGSPYSFADAAADR